MPLIIAAFCKNNILIAKKIKNQFVSRFYILNAKIPHDALTKFSVTVTLSCPSSASKNKYSRQQT